MKIFKVSNLNTAIRFLKKNGYWVAAFDANSKRFNKND